MKDVLLFIAAIAVLIGILISVILLDQYIGFVLAIIWIGVAATVKKKWGGNDS